MGISEECISLKSKVFGGKPTLAEMLFDPQESFKHISPGRQKLNVTEKTKRRRRRRELKMLQKMENLKKQADSTPNAH